MSIIIVSGTGTDVGKTITTAAVGVLARDQGKRVGVLKPVQTGVHIGQHGDIQEIVELGGSSFVTELARYPHPLAPNTAARVAGLSTLSLDVAVEAARELDRSCDLVLIEGSGGLLVHFDDRGTTITELAARLCAPVLVVVAAGLGTLNVTALTLEALRRRDLECPGLVIGRWPAEPDLAALCNLEDLPDVAGVPLLGVLPDGMPVSRKRDLFLEAARKWLAPPLGGELDVDELIAANRPKP